MSIVTDMSVVLAWFFEEKNSDKALNVLRRVENEGLRVPTLWWSELENGILMGERRNRKTTAESAEILKLVRGLPIHIDEAPPHLISNDILALGRRYRLSGYDATYLELAVREKMPLATFDEELRRCGPKIGVEILP